LYADAAGGSTDAVACRVSFAQITQITDCFDYLLAHRARTSLRGYYALHKLRTYLHNLIVLRKTHYTYAQFHSAHTCAFGQFLRMHASL